jgi:hypothetical protein
LLSDWWSLTWSKKGVQAWPYSSNFVSSSGPPLPLLPLTSVRLLLHGNGPNVLALSKTAWSAIPCRPAAIRGHAVKRPLQSLHGAARVGAEYDARSQVRALVARVGPVAAVELAEDLRSRRTSICNHLIVHELKDNYGGSDKRSASRSRVAASTRTRSFLIVLVSEIQPVLHRGKIGKLILESSLTNPREKEHGDGDQLVR